MISTKAKPSANQLRDASSTAVLQDIFPLPARSLDLVRRSSDSVGPAIPADRVSAGSPRALTGRGGQRRAESPRPVLQFISFVSRIAASGCKPNDRLLLKWVKKVSENECICLYAFQT